MFTQRECFMLAAIENYPGRVEALPSKISERAPAFLKRDYMQFY